LEIPLAQGRVPADLQSAVRTALKAGEHSDRLIASLLTLSRGQGIALAEAGDLAVIVDDVTHSITDRIAATGLTAEQTTEPTTILADATMVTQAVTNLLDNAIRHNIPGGRIWISVQNDGSDAVLTVQNTGPVIDPGTVALLCEPFYRSDASRTSVARLGAGTGVGLGLSIVSSINEAHAGRLEIAARVGGGLLVQWRLPRQAIQPAGS
jgi:signal transduction histidine kinase